MRISDGLDDDVDSIGWSNRPPAVSCSPWAPSLRNPRLSPSLLHLEWTDWSIVLGASSLQTSAGLYRSFRADPDDTTLGVFKGLLVQSHGHGIMFPCGCRRHHREGQIRLNARHSLKRLSSVRPSKTQWVITPPAETDSKRSV
jgi:hypothetical protein